ncbi:unnamed protein product [Caenorhabditis auriculariae]|uniref:DUF4139 domain-containing protein n=1 Tax=Caenorhabditis auriculariae TaxID=2777116 RepID=A0A8S1HDA6_9PELO|nr:unnamed protein product [Caenorhabditis auriculariae]
MPKIYDIGESIGPRVVVYKDKADLHREIKILLSVGENEVQLQGFAPCVIADSIRIGTKDGSLNIRDFQFTSAAELKKESSDDDEDKQLEILGKFSENVVISNRSEGTIELSNAALLKFSNFLDYFETKSLDLSGKLRETQEKISKTLKELSGNGPQNNYEPVVLVRIYSPVEADAILSINYQVTNVTWEPSYFIQTDLNGESPKMKIVYNASIHQATKEDWKNAKLVLSTVRSHFSKKLPTLDLLEAKIRLPRITGNLFGSAGFSGAANFGAANFGASAPTKEVEHTTVIDNIVSAEFEIPLETTIESSSSNHRVTIETIELIAKLHRDCVPSKETAVFLQATVVNDSKFVLLAGPAQIFINDSFIQKTFLKYTSPGGEFDLSLGTDPAISVNYLPVQKYHEQSGFIISSSKDASKFSVILKNNRKESALVTIHHQIPRSTDERIKVHLLEPLLDDAENIKENKENAKLSNLNVLEWTVNIDKEQEKEFAIQYVVEHPRDQQVDLVNVQKQGLFLLNAPKTSLRN